jgi:glycerophosphoryl diester phosphodiesterase
MSTVTRSAAVIGAWTHAPVALPVPLVLAHRGSAAADRPENTAAAAVAALHNGADGIEVDVRLSADGLLLCCHDPDLSRLAGSTLSVAANRAATLRRVRLDGGHALAVLEELLSAIAERGPHRVVVEAKECVDLNAARRLAAALREVLGQFAAVLDVTVSSFDPTLLAVIRASLTDIEVGTALLGSTFASGGDLLRHAVTEGHDQIHPYFRTLLREPAVADAARMLGIGVTCWTVNRPHDAERVAALGVDAVITDDVAGVCRVLRSEPGGMDRKAGRSRTDRHARVLAARAAQRS